MTSLTDIPTPALILDLDRLERNLEGMAEKARRLGVSLRPHVKTHKCVEVARRQVELGARGITVSTLYEARVFAEHGFDDITWAFPVILNRLAEVAALAGRVKLRLVVDSREAVEALEQSGAPLHVWLKIDCGYHRAGVDPQGELVLELGRRLAESPTLVFDGLLTHSGHAYKAGSTAARRAVAAAERDVMVEAAERMRAAGVAVPGDSIGVSIGSTPAMALVENLDGVDEVRPGNYALYDGMQVGFGSCGVGECAATVLTSVVSSPAGGDHAVVDAGALALSKDVGTSAGEGVPHYGRVFADYESGRLSEERFISSVSQEHGILSGRARVSEILRILPNHSCLTVAQFDEFVVVRGGEVVDRWRIWRGRD